MLGLVAKLPEGAPAVFHAKRHRQVEDEDIEAHDATQTHDGVRSGLLGDGIVVRVAEGVGAYRAIAAKAKVEISTGVHIEDVRAVEVLLDAGHQHVLTGALLVLELGQVSLNEFGRVNFTFDGARITGEAEARADGHVVVDELLEGQQVAAAQAVPRADAARGISLLTESGVVNRESEDQGHVAGHWAAAEFVPGILVLPGGELGARHRAETQQSEGQ
jgi:hypothetical protein